MPRVHPGGVPGLPDAVTREAYSHEVSSARFWAGADRSIPRFRLLRLSAPDGYSAEVVTPSEAFFEHQSRGAFVVLQRRANAPDPDQMLLSFLDTTYDAAALTCQLGPASAGARHAAGSTCRDRSSLMTAPHSAPCPLLAQSRRSQRRGRCPLLTLSRRALRTLGIRS